MLDEKHDYPEDFFRHSRDTNQYYLGRIGQHNVVITSLPSAEYGTVSAATTASNILSTFPHIRIGLLVGIGAGLPLVRTKRVKKERDIRLGDVVVSEPSGTNSGVVQYDLGKDKGDDKFERVGFLGAPPEVLRKGLSSLKMKYRSEGSDIPNILEEMLQKYPRLREPDSETESPAFAYQGSQNDRLFETSSAHVELDDSEAEEEPPCSNCDAEKEVRRKVRASTVPRIHYGTIASGNSVVKHSASREKIMQRLSDDCLCFEMEAAGLMNHFPCLVIRGICDYADAHKNDRWQNYVAATSAAFAKSLLKVLQPQEVENEKSMNEALGKIQKDISRISEISHSEQIERWLHPADASTNLNRAAKHSMKSPNNTGPWFLGSEMFAKWKDGSIPHLWLNGIPGCGKTVLSSLIVKALGQQCLYYFFDFSDSEKKTLDSLIRSLIHQVRALKRSDMMSGTERLLGSCGPGRAQPETDRLSDILDHMFTETGSVQVVIDAFDESTEVAQVVAWLRGFCERQAKVHLIVTSRPLESIKLGFDQWIPKQAAISVDGAKTDEDIKRYIRLRLNEGSEFKEWRKEPSEMWKVDIETTLTKKTNGMFRLAALQLDALAECRTLRDLEETLERLPGNLSNTYDRIMTKIPVYYRRDAVQLLQFIPFSGRPLELYEAIDAMAVDLTRDQPFEPKNRLWGFKDISDILPGLVSIEERRAFGRIPRKIRSYVHLAHASVKEYLLSNPLAHLSFPEQTNNLFEDCLSEFVAKATMVRACLAYFSGIAAIVRPLHYYRGWDIMTQFPFTKHIMTLDNALFDYFEGVFYLPRCRWMLFLEQEEVWREIQEPILEFMVKQPPSFVLFKLPYECEMDCEGQISPLLVAIIGGVDHAVQLLADPDTLSIHDESWPSIAPLVVACTQQSKSIVELLLKKGADPREPRGLPLLSAVIMGNVEIALLLLDFGADINADNGEALKAACRWEQVDMVELLLRRGADPGIPKETTPDCFSPHEDYTTNIVLFKHSEVIYDLLENCAFYKACAQRSADICRLFMQYRSEVMDVATHALYIACYEDIPDTVQVLLENGAKHSLGYMEELDAACEWANGEVVELLLGGGADPIGWHGSPLVTACRWGYIDMVRLLLDHGANVNETPYTKYHGDPSSAESEEAHAKRVGRRRWSALDIARGTGQKRLAKLLLEYGAISLDNDYPAMRGPRFCDPEIESNTESE